jgi:glycosyltransferase involved in cell wall biosynthesis
MRVTYVLPFPELNGGNKVIFQHARLLAERGDEVTLLGEGPRPDWIEVPRYHDYSRADARDLPRQDLVIATYWTTVALARGLGLGPVAHFCQGYEGDLEHLDGEREAIEAAYRLPLPTLTVTPYLAAQLAERFGRRSRVVPPPLDSHFRPRWWRGWLGPRRRPWIAVPGIFEAPVKGVPTALAAVSALRGRGIPCRVLRISVLPLSDAERAGAAPDRALVGVHPREVARELSRCDLLMLASRDAEGFGLPVLEAMASGVPVVASRIPPTEFVTAQAAELVPVDDVAGFADAAERLLRQPERWRRARRRGLTEAERFAASSIAESLHDAVRWAAAAP